MTNLSTKIKLYANQEVDFTKDVKLARQLRWQRSIHS
jgi:hypothetical protein